MNSYCLSEGDIIKIGRITARVRTIKFKKNDDLNASIHTQINPKENEKNELIIKKKHVTQIKITPQKNLKIVSKIAKFLIQIKTYIQFIIITIRKFLQLKLIITKNHKAKEKVIKIITFL